MSRVILRANAQRWLKADALKRDKHRETLGYKSFSIRGCLKRGKPVVDNPETHFWQSKAPYLQAEQSVLQVLRRHASQAESLYLYETILLTTEARAYPLDHFLAADMLVVTQG